VTKISDGAFFNCTSLTSITIPNSVASISNYAFAYCKSLKSITLPNSVTKIGSIAFNGCTSLTSITIPNSVTKIGKNAFSSCTSLTIYAEATSKPAGWDADWNPNKQPVKWGYKVNKIKESYNESFKESLDIKSKTLLDAIEEVFECSYEPVHGATYLLPNGKFVNLDKYFKLHQEYDYEWEFAYHGMIQEILSPYFNILNEEEDPLLNEGCIRLNDAYYEDAYCYIQLSEKISPTNTQYTSLAEWVNNLNNNIHLEIGTTQIVKGYDVGYKENQVSAEEIIKEIRQYYVTGRLGRLEEKLSKEQLPKYLYHATYGPYFEQIKRDGAIKIKPPHKNWIFSNEYDTIDAIYLAGDPDVAISYAETSETTEEELLENIILLTIDTSKLDKSQLYIDHNVKLDSNKKYNKEELTYEYYKDIPLSAIVEREIYDESLDIASKKSSNQIKSIDNKTPTSSNNINESTQTNEFEPYTAGYILDDGSLLVMDEYHGEEEVREKYPEYSNTHPEEDTCVRIFERPNDAQYKKLEEIIDYYLDNDEYCKVEIRKDFYNVYSLREGACEDPYWDEKIGNWTGYKLVQTIKNYFNNKANESTDNKNPTNSININESTQDR